MKKEKMVERIYNLVSDGVTSGDYSKINQAEQLAIENEIFMQFDEDRIFVEDDCIEIPNGIF